MRHRRWLPLLAIVATLGGVAPPAVLASPRDDPGRQGGAWQGVQTVGQPARQAAGRAAAAQAAQAATENTPRGHGNQVAAAQAAAAQAAQAAARPVQAALERPPQGVRGGETVARTTSPGEGLEQRNGGRQGPGGNGGQAGNRGNGGPGAAAAGAPRERGPNGGHPPQTTAVAGAPGGTVTGPSELPRRGPRGGGTAAVPGNATPPSDQNEEPRQGPRRPVAPPAITNVAPTDPPGEPRRSPARVTQQAGNGGTQTAVAPPAAPAVPPPGRVAPATTTVGAANELIVQQGQSTPRTTVVTERVVAPAPNRVVRPRWDRDLRPALAPLPGQQLVVHPPGLPPRPLPVFAPEPFLPLLPPRVLVPVPVPVPVLVPQPVVVLVPVFVPPPPPLIVQQLVPAPCLIPVPEVLPGPLPLVVPELVPGTCLVLVPVVVPQPGQALFPPLYGAVLPALSTVFAPDPFQELPLQFVPVAETAGDYLLAHPALVCDLDAALSCEEAVEQLNAVAPGFGTTVTDGPEGYGVYLTYNIHAEAWD